MTVNFVASCRVGKLHWVLGSYVTYCKCKYLSSKIHVNANYIG